MRHSRYGCRCSINLLVPPLPLSSYPIQPSPILKNLPYLNPPLTPPPSASLPQKHRLNLFFSWWKEVTCNGNAHTNHLPVQSSARIFLIVRSGFVSSYLKPGVWWVEGYFYRIQISWHSPKFPSYLPSMFFFSVADLLFFPLGLVASPSLPPKCRCDGGLDI